MILQGQKIDASMKICQTHEHDKSMKALGVEMRKRDQCSEVVTQTSANSYATESRCAKGMNAGEVTKVTLTLRGDSAMHMEMHMPAGKSETVNIVDSKYLGSCPAGMKPGDIVMTDGKKSSYDGK